MVLRRRGAAAANREPGRADDGDGPHAVGMDPEGRRRRFRCACRGWFRPHAAAVRVQKTCSLTCRRRRRRRLAKERREKDVLGCRTRDRERQRRRRSVPPEAGGAARAPVSRAGLPLEVAGLLEDALELWDRAAALSRAGLRREFLLGLRVAAALRRQAEIGGDSGSDVSRADLLTQVIDLQGESGGRRRQVSAVVTRRSLRTAALRRVSCRARIG